MEHEMYRLSKRTACRYVLFYTPFLPEHTRYGIVKVPERPSLGIL